MVLSLFRIFASCPRSNKLSIAQSSKKRTKFKITNQTSRLIYVGWKQRGQCILFSVVFTPSPRRNACVISLLLTLIQADILKVSTNEKRGGLKVEAFDRSYCKLFSLFFWPLTGLGQHKFVWKFPREQRYLGDFEWYHFQPASFLIGQHL
jgi:hypothetical protein